MDANIATDFAKRASRSNLSMQAARVHRFGSPDVIAIETMARPIPLHGEVLVKVLAAGVGPWDAWVRSGHSALPQPLPLTLGSDLSGIVETVGPGVAEYSTGDKVYGVTNAQFTGAYAEYAIASAGMLAPMPNSLSYVQAASVTVVAITAWQMLFDKAKVTAKQNVLILGGAGNVGEYAVRLAHLHRANVWATAADVDAKRITDLGANHVVDIRKTSLRELSKEFDVVIDTIGGETQIEAMGLLKRGGVLVSAVSPPDPMLASQVSVSTLFFLVQVTHDSLQALARLFDAGKIQPHVGTVLPLRDARGAHEMLEGLRARVPGKIVLNVADQ